MTTLDLFAPAARAWSPQQRAVFDAVAFDTGHLLVRARAGTGKTTTIVEALNRAPRGARVLLCAFNKSIAEELQGRAPKGVEVCTLHSLGYRALLRHWPGAKVDKLRDRRIAERVLGPRHAKHWHDFGQVVSLCKARLELDPARIERAVRTSDLVLPGVTDRQTAALVLEAMDAACERDNCVSFDDMVFVPVAAGLAGGGTYDMVFVDETQDMSKAQLELARMALARETGRLVLVGDDRQAIYGWRGADVGGMDRMREELDARELPLSVTYRCGRVIAGLAAEVVPDFEAGAGAPEGAIESCHVERAGWREGDAVLSRVNAPLITLALRALRDGKRARIQGRDIAAGLRNWIRGLGERAVPALLRVAEGWLRDELERLGADDEDAADQARDRVEMLKALSEGVATADAVLARVEALFSDAGPGLVFSSTHRAKGLEWDRVWLLAWTYRPERSEEEENLWYVALTRAKATLVLVTGERAVTDERVSDALRAAAPRQGAAA